MTTDFYQGFEILIDFILSLMVASYVFQLPPIKNLAEKSIFYAGSLLLCIPVKLFYGISLLPAAIAVRCFMKAKKLRVLKMLQCFSITGIVYGIRLPLVELPSMLFRFQTHTKEIWAVSVNCVFLALIAVFIVKGRNWRREFQNEMEYRHLKRWEHQLVNVVGVLMFGFAPVLRLYQKMDDDNYQNIAMVTNSGLCIIAFIMTLTVITLIIQGNKQARFHEQVVNMQHNIIITMADIVENRDENTGGHIRRTAKYVEIIAKKLVEQKKYRQILTKQYISDMIIAAPLHDMGKIHVPDAVLKKQGSLTDEEFQVMQDHTTAGRKLLMQTQEKLGKFSYLEMAVQMAGCHHECWDGSGYPEHLKEQDIPLCARIMAVADVFDALVSSRCYKEALPLSEAYEILRQESGTHFDPVVIDAFFAATDEIEAVWNALKEEA